MRPLMVPFGDCANGTAVRRRSTNNGRRKANLTRVAPDVVGFIQIHPVYGSPLVFVSIIFRMAA
jgi:hypothetical protein